MKKISVFQADGVEPVTIHISGHAPAFPSHDPHWRAKAESMRDEQAHALCDVLFDTLPGGVLKRTLK